ncbi:MAG: hypothetical protein IKV85_04545 [Ruminococcus sp.]|nr:hypothetical protein [Ruminococcus sp.]
MRGNMTEKAVFVSMLIGYAIMMGVCLWVLYCIYKAFSVIIRELIEDIKEGKYEEETEEIMRSGETERGTEFSGSNGRDAEKEEGGKWQKKKS